MDKHLEDISNLVEISKTVDPIKIVLAPLFALSNETGIVDPQSSHYNAQRYVVQVKRNLLQR